MEIYCQVIVTIDGVWIGKLDLLNSYRSVATSNYNRFTNTHTLQFTTAHTLP
jgi:hypothetical protein